MSPSARQPAPPLWRQCRLTACALLMGALAACSGSDSTVTDRTFLAFSTTVRLTIVGATPEAAATAGDELERLLLTASKDWYAFGDGELAAVNEQLSLGLPAKVSPNLAPLIARAIELHGQSQGLFDPAVCAMVALWQFDREEALAVATGPPADADIQALRERQGGMSDLRFDGRTLTPRRPLCLDLGGMAKGTALERARTLLVKLGITNALLDIGGSSQLTLGENRIRPWRIGLKDPRSSAVLGTLTLAPGETASTSGDYERSYVRDGRRYHHILDPRLGKPTTNSASVTVIGRDGELTDAASTALMVGGLERFLDLCAALGIDDAMLITTTGVLRATPSLRARLLRDNGGPLPGMEAEDL